VVVATVVTRVRAACVCRAVSVMAVMTVLAAARFAGAGRVPAAVNGAAVALRAAMMVAPAIAARGRIPTKSLGPLAVVAVTVRTTAAVAARSLTSDPWTAAGAAIPRAFAATVAGMAALRVAAAAGRMPSRR